MTATLDILAPDEFNRLSAAYDAAAGQNQDNLGVWAPAYNLLYDFLSAKSSAVPVDKTTLLWISGARFVNPGIGLFGALIRDYTKAQFLQRYGRPLSDAQANLASNNIAKAFIGQWLGKNPAFPGGTQPTITETGIYDAGAAASGVFGTPYTPDPENAAGWAGVILFPNFGAPDFYSKLILAGLLDPKAFASYPLTDSKGNTTELRSVDYGSYDAIAAAAALEAFAKDSGVFGALNGLIWPKDWPQLGSVYDQFGSAEIVRALAKNADSDFQKYYDLQSGDPLWNSPNIGSDTLGVFGVNVASNLFKNANYAVGTIKNDTIDVASLQTGLLSYLKTPTVVLNAGRGDDLVFSANGPNILDGGDGTDTVSYDHLDAVNVHFYLKESLAQFDAEVDKSSFFGLFGSRDVDYNFETIIGSRKNDTFGGKADGSIGETSNLPSGFVIDGNAGDDQIRITGDYRSAP